MLLKNIILFLKNKKPKPAEFQPVELLTAYIETLIDLRDRELKDTAGMSISMELQRVREQLDLWYAKVNKSLNQQTKGNNDMSLESALVTLSEKIVELIDKLDTVVGSPPKSGKTTTSTTPAKTKATAGKKAASGKKTSTGKKAASGKKDESMFDGDLDDDLDDDLDGLDDDLDGLGDDDLDGDLDDDSDDDLGDDDLDDDLDKEEGISIDDITAKSRELNKIAGRPIALKVLKKFNAKKVAEIDKSDYENFIKTADAMIRKAKATK